MSTYRLVRKKYGICEDWIYPQKRIFSFLGIINIWSNIDSEGTPTSISSFGVKRFYGNDEKELQKAIYFLNRLHSSSNVIYER